MLTCFLAQAQVFSCIKDAEKRTRITSESTPNNYTCYMEMTRGGETRYGTGFLIHPRVVLTAGHNLAYFPTGIVKHAKMFFGSIDSTTYKTSIDLDLKRGYNKFYKSNYFIFHSIKRDFAIIILPDSAVYEKVGGHYVIQPITDYDIEDITITGSPGDKELFEIWTESTTHHQLFSDHIKYDLYTEVRNSGSPIWYADNDEYRIVGIHSRGFGSCSAAVLITPKVYAKLKKWCRKAGIEL